MKHDKVETSNVVAPKTFKTFSRRWTAIAIAGTLVFVLLGAGGAWLYYKHSQRQPQYTGQALTAAVDKANASGDYSKTVKLLEGQKIQDYDTLITLVAAYVNNKQYDKALQVLDKLEAEGQLKGSHLIFAGSIAEMKGDKKQALAYYRKAKGRITAESGTDTNSGIRRQLRTCDKKIAELEAAQ